LVSVVIFERQNVRQLQIGHDSYLPHNTGSLTYASVSATKVIKEDNGKWKMRDLYILADGKKILSCILGVWGGERELIGFIWFSRNKNCWIREYHNKF
jgi:hypothetical protein